MALGAFAAHGLKTRRAENLLITFETGVRYQLYHALALLAVGLAYARWPGPVMAASGFMFVVGTVPFSGSLYALSLSEMRWHGQNELPHRQHSSIWYRPPQNSVLRTLSDGDSGIQVLISLCHRSSAYGSNLASSGRIRARSGCIRFGRW